MTVIEEKLIAVLQRRGQFSTERMKPSFFPGCLQVTCHGKLDEDEDFLEALGREVNEELGSKFAGTCQSDIKVLETIDKVEMTNTSEKEVITFGALVPAEYIKLIRLGPDSGGLQYFRKERFEKTVLPITKDMKIFGPEHNLPYMFQDEIEAVKKAFNLFEKAAGTQKS
jgi:hypothetical protein